MHIISALFIRLRSWSVSTCSLLRRWVIFRLPNFYSGSGEFFVHTLIVIRSHCTGEKDTIYTWKITKHITSTTKLSNLTSGHWAPSWRRSAVSWDSSAAALGRARSRHEAPLPLHLLRRLGCGSVPWRLPDEDRFPLRPGMWLKLEWNAL